MASRRFELLECFHQGKTSDLHEDLRTKVQCTHVEIKRVGEVEIDENKNHQMLLLNETDKEVQKYFNMCVYLIITST